MYSHLATLEYLRSSRRPCLRTLEAVRGSSRRVANFSIQGLFPGTGFFYKKPLCRMLEKGFQRRINREVSVSVGKSGASAKQPFYLQSDQLRGKFDWPAITKKREFLLFFFLFHFLILLRVFISFLPSLPYYRPGESFYFEAFSFSSLFQLFMKARLITSSDVIVEKKFLQEFVKIHGTIFEFNGFWDRIVSIKKKKGKEKNNIAIL